MFHASVVEMAFSQSVYTVREDEGSVQLVLTKSGSNARDVSVAFTTKDITAMSKAITTHGEGLMCD